MQEICINLWFLIDEGVGYVYALMGRTYMLSGSDKEKLKILHSLAPTDYHVAIRYRVPENYTVIDEAGNARKRLCDPRTVTNFVTDVFAEVINEIEKGLPPARVWRNGEMTIEDQKIPDAPLMVCTGLLEHNDGSITPLVKPLG